MDAFDDNIKTIEENLKEIQSILNEYQNENFPERSPEFFCLELNGEAGELANAEKKRWKGRFVPDEKYSDEAADSFIALLNYSNARGVNLGTAVRKKIKKIEKERNRLEREGKEY